MPLPAELLRQIEEGCRRVDQEIRAALPTWDAQRNQIIHGAITRLGAPEPTLEELVAIETYLRPIRA